MKKALEETLDACKTLAVVFWLALSLCFLTLAFVYCRNVPNWKVNDCLVVYPSFKAEKDLEPWEVGKAIGVLQVKEVGKNSYLLMQTRRNLATGKLVTEEMSFSIRFLNDYAGSNLKDCSAALSLL